MMNLVRCPMCLALVPEGDECQDGEEMEDGCPMGTDCPGGDDDSHE